MKYLTYKELRDAMDLIVKEWGKDGEKVIETAFYQERFNGTINEFITHCTTCGGNWNGMLLSGIHKIYPEVWEAIPEHLGKYGFALLTFLLYLLGVYPV